MTTWKSLHITSKRMIDNKARHDTEDGRWQGNEISNPTVAKDMKKSEKRCDDYEVYGSASLRLRHLRKRLAESGKCEDGNNYRNDNVSTVKKSKSISGSDNVCSEKNREHHPKATVLPSADIESLQCSKLQMSQQSPKKFQGIERSIVGSISSKRTTSDDMKCKHIQYVLGSAGRSEKASSSSGCSHVKKTTGSVASGVQGQVNCDARDLTRRPLWQGPPKGSHTHVSSAGSSRAGPPQLNRAASSQSGRRAAGSAGEEGLSSCKSLPSYSNRSYQPSHHIPKTDNLDTGAQSASLPSSTNKNNDSDASARHINTTRGIDRPRSAQRKAPSQLTQPKCNRTVGNLLAAQIEEVVSNFPAKYGAQNKVTNLLNNIQNKRKRKKKKKVKDKANDPKPPCPQTTSAGSCKKEKAHSGSGASVPQRARPVEVPSRQPDPPALNDSMEWEPIEEEKILSHIEQLRRCRPAAQPSGGELAQLCGAPGTGPAVGDWCVVLDTNVLLSSCSLLSQLLEGESVRPGLLLLLPWTVVQELDHIKGVCSQPQLQACARRAIRFLHRHLSERHPRLRGQTRAEAEKVKDDLPDDHILRCCEQVKNSCDRVLLLTNDKNLSSKALINGVDSCSAGELQRRLAEGRRSSPVCAAGPAPDRSDDQCRLQQTAQLAAQVKACLRDLLADVLEQEMRSAFDNMWTHVVARKPPWSLRDVLFCLLKHWVAVFGLVLPASVRLQLEELQDLARRSLASWDADEVVQHWLKHARATVLLLPTLTYLEPVNKATHTLDGLEQELQRLQQPSPAPATPPVQTAVQIAVKTLAQPPAKADTVASCQQSLELVQRCFNCIWEKTAIFCGVLCEAMGVAPCVPYQRPEPFPPADSLRQPLGFFLPCVNTLVRCMDGVCHLLAAHNRCSRCETVPQAASHVPHTRVHELECMCRVLAVADAELTPVHPALLALLQALQEALVALGCGDWPSALAPLDLQLYCTQAHTRQQLFCGKQQFQQFQAVLVQAAASPRAAL